MKKIFTCLLIVFFTQQIAFAQSNFKPGYIVTLKGDTLRGFIDYKQWNETPQEIRFKNTSNNIKPYNISNALAFGINGLDYFERHIVQVSMDEVELTKISTRDTSAKTDTVFLQMVTRGKNLNLYLYTDFTKSRLYVWPAGAPGPYELIYHVYMDIENANQVITQNTYRQQLIGLAYRFRKNDEKIVSDIQQAEYHEDDLMGIVDQINGSTHKTTASVHKYGHRFFAGAGVNIEALAYKGRIDLAFGATTQISYYPKIDVGIDLFTNTVVRKSFFRFEAAFTGANLRVDAFDAYQVVHQRTVSLALQFVYNFYNSDSFKFYGSGGASVNFSKYPENTSHYNDTAGDHVFEDYPQLRPIWLSIPFRLGVVTKRKFDMYVSYAPPVSITNNYLNFTGNSPMIQGGVNYLFK